MRLLGSCVLLSGAVLLQLLSPAMGQENDNGTVTFTFPSNFIWATATSSFQIEGAAAEGGRGPSIWDTYEKIPGTIRDNDTGAIAADSYHHIPEDIAILKELGVDAYRFSLSWSRIFPTGTIDSLNPEGVKYYDDLITALVNNGIKPIVTLYHWDLPQALQDKGGWVNREIVNWFGDYAKFCFAMYGSKVHHWITLNEPYTQTLYGYGNYRTKHAPQLVDADSWTMYIVGHHMLLAHATAYRHYEQNFKQSQKGVVGISNVFTWLLPSDPQNQDDIDTAQRLLEARFGWFTDPLVFGDYPQSLKDSVKAHSLKTGRVNSLLPEFTAEEKTLLAGTLDFLGINYYVSIKVKPTQGNSTYTNLMAPIFGAFGYYDPEWERIDNNWVTNTPFGLYNGLKYIRDNYDNIPAFITENGCMDTQGEGLNDVSRIKYISYHLAAIGKAIEECCNVIGYNAWSLMDNFEWTQGYAHGFGLYKVDFSDPQRPRTAKESAFWYNGVLTNSSVTVAESVDEYISSESQTYTVGKHPLKTNRVQPHNGVIPKLTCSSNFTSYLAAAWVTMLCLISC